MRRFARGLQVVALFVLPLSMVLQIANGISVKQMLMLLVAGFSLFYIGRIVEAYS
jgi:hypothetical protein